MSETKRSDTCGDKSCACHATSLDRREFIKVGVLGAAMSAGLARAAMAGPFTRADFDKLVPADKKLSPEWLKSLTDRGVPTVYRGEELKYIGMPIGGICAGQLYLGGDGRLWHWGIFNKWANAFDQHYVKPPLVESPVKQGFSLRFADGQTRPLDVTGFPGVTFRGEYPIGTVEYHDDACPIAVKLEAFSPFIPLNTEDSSLPVTILHFTLRNTSSATSEATLVGSLENAVLLHHRDTAGSRLARRIDAENHTFLAFSAEQPKDPPTIRPEILFEDWSKDTYEGWTVEGDAFGAGPIAKAKIPAYQGNVGGDTPRVVNSHATAPGKDSPQRDRALGKLTSRPFTIERNYIRLWVGGGNHQGKDVCQRRHRRPRSSEAWTGPNSNEMVDQAMDVRGIPRQEGRAGNRRRGARAMGQHRASDESSWPIAVRTPSRSTNCTTMAQWDSRSSAPRRNTPAPTRPVPLSETLVGKLGRAVKLAAGESVQVTFVVVWHFPNLKLPDIQGWRWTMVRDPLPVGVGGGGLCGEELQPPRSRDASVAGYVVRLVAAVLVPRSHARKTRRSSRPTPGYRFANGRFYGWEGVGCCPGTCTHVWHYAHSVARLFPELERILRERVDFGLALQGDGSIRFRGEANDGPAADGQAGSILRAYREHQMTADNAFLHRNWPNIKKALQYLIHEDADGDGILSGSQHNTLDSNWHGPVAWLSGLYPRGVARRRRNGQGDRRRCLRPRVSRDLRERHEEDRRNALRRRVLHQQARPQAPRGDQLRHRLRDRPGDGTELGVPGGPRPRAAAKGDPRGAAVAVGGTTSHPTSDPTAKRTRRAAGTPWPARRALLMCTFPRSDWDFAKAGGKGNPGFAALFQRVYERFRVSSRRPHDLGGHGRRGAGDRTRRPRPLPRLRGATRGTRSSAATITPVRWPPMASSLPRAGTSTTGRKVICRLSRVSARRTSKQLSRRPKAGAPSSRNARPDEQVNTVAVRSGKLRLTQLTIEVPEALAEAGSTRDATSSSDARRAQRSPDRCALPTRNLCHARANAGGGGDEKEVIATRGFPRAEAAREAFVAPRTFWLVTPMRAGVRRPVRRKVAWQRAHHLLQVVARKGTGPCFRSRLLGGTRLPAEKWTSPQPVNAYPGQKWNKNRPGQLYNEAYGPPKQLIGGKDKITIRFQGRPGNFAGGAFECRVLKKE